MSSRQIQLCVSVPVCKAGSSTSMGCKTRGVPIIKKIRGVGGGGEGVVLLGVGYGGRTYVMNGLQISLAQIRPCLYDTKSI